jgi:hypothetical protein
MALAFLAKIFSISTSPVLKSFSYKASMPKSSKALLFRTCSAFSNVLLARLQAESCDMVVTVSKQVISRSVS